MQVRLKTLPVDGGRGHGVDGSGIVVALLVMAPTCCLIQQHLIWMQKRDRIKKVDSVFYERVICPRYKSRRNEILKKHFTQLEAAGFDTFLARP